MKQINDAILKAELRELMETIQEQIDILEDYDGNIPIIEFDIIMENVRKLHEDLRVWSRINNPKESMDQKKQSAEPFLKEPAKVMKEEPIVEDKINPAEPSILTRDSEFNQKLKEARERSFTPRFKQPDVSDLKAMININEKFLFINGLFDGNLKEYAKAIDFLNSMKEKRTLFDALLDMQKKNLWDAGSDAFLKLKTIVEKRFAG